MKARASTVFLILVSSVISFPLKAIAETILENELKLYLQPIQNYAYACHYDTAARISLVGKISGKILTAGQRWTKIDAAAQLKKLRQRFKNASSGKAKARKNLKNFKAIIKGCSSFHATAGPGDPGGPPIPTPTPTVIINPPTGEFVGVEGLLVPYREALTSAEASYVACKFALCSPRHRQIAEVQGLTAFANALMSTAPVAVCENKARSVVTVPDAQWTTRNGQDYFLTHIHCADGNPFKEWMAYLGFNLWVANLSAVGGDGPNPVPNLVASYISLIRSNILGSLETLLEVLVFNSAVGRYLDLFDNHYVNGVINGNENWARELLELFSVRPSNPLSGDSNYTENDVVRCFSRSFSGFVLSPDGTTSWDSSKWDPNMKTCFDGKPFQETAVFNYESLLPKLLRTHPETARSWVMQMYSFMIGKQPTMAMVDELAADLVNNNFDTRQVLTKIIRSNDTFSPSAQNRYVQNPLEVLMRLFRAFNLPLSNQAGADMYTLILDILESSGQPLFQPPTVFGFDERKNRGAGFSIGEIWAPMGRQLEFMRGLTRILDTLEAQGFAWTSIMPSQNASPRQLIDHCASKLGVQLSEPQKIILENYLTSILPNGSSTPVNIGWNPAAPNFQAQLKLKLPGLLYSLLTGINQIRTM